jgi:adenylosuccinate lyase
MRTKGFKGAVGTSAAYADLVGAENVAEMESEALRILDLRAFPVTTQVYPRKQDYKLLCVLAGVAASLHRMALDLRLLQSPYIGEALETPSLQQVGSSAMPFKNNPINAENIDSLARLVASLPRVAWDNAAHSAFERTLDDKANRRVILAQAFLAVEEMLLRMTRILDFTVFDFQRIIRNVLEYGRAAKVERVMLAAVRSGADRSEIHEAVQDVVRKSLGHSSPTSVTSFLEEDERITRWVSAERIRELCTVRFIGNAARLSYETSLRLHQYMKSADDNVSLPV